MWEWEVPEGQSQGFYRGLRSVGCFLLLLLLFLSRHQTEIPSLRTHSSSFQSPQSDAAIYLLAYRSESLVKIASQHAPHTSILADILSLPHPRSSFDFVISIAVIHHLSTSARRIEALAAILETLRSPSSSSDRDPDDNKATFYHRTGGGRALIYVWALEQKTSRRGWDEGDAQDVMVPWVMRVSSGSNDQQDPEGLIGRTKTKTLERYYHLYRRGELEDDIRRAGGTVESSGYENHNWWAIASRCSSSSSSIS